MLFFNKKLYKNKSQEELIELARNDNLDALEELIKRNQALRMLKSGAFKKIIMLGNRNSPGEIRKIYRVDELDVENHGFNNDCIDREP